jgi:DNA-binding MarR family transcriptional regulator
MPEPLENPDPLAEPRCVTDLLLYRMSVVTRSTSLPLVRIFEGEFDITRRHWHILALLVEHGAMPSSRLATLCWLDAPRISRAVSGLSEKGLVARTAGAAGAARSRSLIVTDKGIELYGRAMQRVSALNAELARTMSLEERRAFDGMLRRLQARAMTLADEVARSAPPSARHKGRR